MLKSTVQEYVKELRQQHFLSAEVSQRARETHQDLKDRLDEVERTKEAAATHGEKISVGRQIANLKRALGEIEETLKHAKLTPMTEEEGVEQVMKMLRLTRSCSAIDGFRKHLEKDPVYALEWAGGVVKEAIKNRCVEAFERASQNGLKALIEHIYDTEEYIIMELTEHSISHSSSAFSNAVELEKVAAHKEILRVLRYQVTTIGIGYVIVSVEG